MLKYIGLFMGMFTGAVCFGQDTLTTWYDGFKQETTETDAVYYRQYWQEGALWQVRDYIRNGTIQMEGTFLSLEPEVKEGSFVFYHMNGSKSSEGNYIDNYKVGEWSEWFRDGTLSGKGTYILPDDLPDDGNSDEYDYFLDEEPEDVDLRDGEWEFYHFNGQMSARLSFAENMIISRAYWHEDGSETKNYIEDRHPEFPGGDQALMHFLGNNIQYPDEDKDAGTSGTAYVQFIVDRDGNVINPVVVKGVSETIDAECLRVVKSMPLWKPGVQFNSRKDMDYMLPIRFTYKEVNGRKFK